MLTYKEYQSELFHAMMDYFAESVSILAEAKEQRMPWPKNPFAADPEWQKVEQQWQAGEYDKVAAGMTANWPKVEPYATEGLAQFKDIVKRVAGRALRTGKFLWDIKKLPSAINKAIERGERNQNPVELGDLVRGTILVDSENELATLVKDFKRKTDVIQYEEKTQAEDPDFGYYGSHHFDIRLPNGMIAELQIMTKRLHKMKEKFGHEIYTKGRKVNPETGKREIVPDVARTSKLLYQIGNRPKGSSPKGKLAKTFKGV